MELRPYQEEARRAVERDWEGDYLRTLLVLPTGCGKTVVFSKIVEDMVRQGSRCLILAHRGELLDQAADLAGYRPAFGWEMGPPTEKQKAALENLGIFPDEIESAGKASLILDRLSKRRAEGLTTPKQIRFLEGKGFVHVGQWQFETAKNMIDRIAANRWQVPRGIDPAAYVGA